MDEKQLLELKNKVDQIAEHSIKLVASAKASSEIAYQASVENVKSNKNLEAKLDNYICKDNEWKTRAEPVILLGNRAKDTSKAILWIAGLILAVGGAITMIKGFFIKN